jgi:Icc-related predicted phosphoesterase
MRVLALSDIADDRAYASVRASAGRVDLVLGCGDLPYDYLDFAATELSVPLLAVHGNHDTPFELVDDPEVAVWWRGINVHGRVIAVDGVLVAGLGGARRYNDGPFQLSETDMWLAIARMLPALVANRIARGRWCDVLITHSPPRGIHDLPDAAHRGFVAVRWFLRLFSPRYHFHGHSHVYDRRTVTQTQFGRTTVVNAYGVREVELDGRR